MIIDKITKTITYRLRGICPYCRNDLAIRITDKEIERGQLLFHCDRCYTEQELKPDVVKKILKEE